MKYYILWKQQVEDLETALNLLYEVSGRLLIKEQKETEEVKAIDDAMRLIFGVVDPMR